MAMNFARSAALAAMITTLSVVCATAKPVNTTGETNLRKAPGTDSEKQALVPKGTAVEIGKCSNGWCQVSWNGQGGYAIARNLGMAPPAAPAKPAAAITLPEIPVDAVREAPGNASAGPHLGLRYDGPYDERIVTGAGGLAAGTDPDPNIRAYMRRDSRGAGGAPSGSGR
jgi:uncharacterized protein YgiM (DUF1202 family)